MGALRRRPRVIAGAARSVPLQGLPRGVRPTTERVREVLFSSLGQMVEGQPFVDLYAGGGAVGIEALSRGASRCLFVERDSVCARTIQENLMRTQLADRGEVWRRDVGRALDDIVRWLGGEPAVIFADPPYHDPKVKRIWGALLAHDGVAAGTVFILEHSLRDDISGLPRPSWQRRAGETCLARWEKQPNE